MKYFVRIAPFIFFSMLLFSQSPPDSTAILLFGGDLNFAYRFEQSMGRRVDKIFSRWQKIGAYDAMMVNLENAVTQSIDSMKKEFVFKMRPDYLLSFHDARITLVNCANNHTADFGEEGILETMRLLDSANIQHVGIGRNLTEARTPVVVNIHGIRIGFLGYGGNGENYAGRSNAGTTPLHGTLILSDVRKLRKKVDFIVVNFHWGEELADTPSVGQIILAHRVIDAGADLIIGHHPHVLQGIERYKKGVIAYSLGNFIFGGNARNANGETAVLRVCFECRGLEAELLPVQIRSWLPEPADTVSAMQVRQLVQERSKIFKNPIRINIHP